MSKEALERIKAITKAFDKDLYSEIALDIEDIEQAIEELDKFKTLLNKYEIKDIQALEELIKDYDDMAKSLIQYALGIEVEVKS